jgi:hypothetical protein
MVDPDRCNPARGQVLRERQVTPAVFGVAVTHHDDAAWPRVRLEPAPGDADAADAVERAFGALHGALRTRATAARQPR